MSDWEIVSWLSEGRQLYNGRFKICARDQRIRCPVCVVNNSNVNSTKTGAGQEIIVRQRTEWRESVLSLRCMFV